MQINYKYGEDKLKEELRKIFIDCRPSGGVSWLTIVAVSRKRCHMKMFDRMNF